MQNFFYQPPFFPPRVSRPSLPKSFEKISGSRGTVRLRDFGGVSGESARRGMVVGSLACGRVPCIGATIPCGTSDLFTFRSKGGYSHPAETPP
jgi:hypothetical protein